MKWTITGNINGEDFEAQIEVDDDGDIVGSEAPLTDYLGDKWRKVKQIFINLGYHGQPQSTPMVEGNSELKRRGWTDSQITKYLDEPDELRPNPHHPSGSPMRCYLLSRIQLIEQQYSIGTSKPKPKPKAIAN